MTAGFSLPYFQKVKVRRLSLIMRVNLTKWQVEYLLHYYFNHPIIVSTARLGHQLQKYILNFAMTVKLCLQFVFS
jgi:hypothetical protein